MATVPRAIGRYLVFGEIASGGMATVHYGRLVGPSGFSRTVALKRLHPQYAKDPDFRAMFLDEARLAGRIQHPNVVSTLDVVEDGDELFVVLEYVHGESLAKLVRAAQRDGSPIPLDIAAAILCDVLHGLHAAHQATGENGEPLGIVHRDVSPQNILVGADGISKVLDFGVAKAAGRLHVTRDGQVKGKIAYMAPEQLRGGAIDRRTDLYAAGIVFWEILTGRRLFAAENEGMTAVNALERPVEAPSRFASHVPDSVDRLVLRALSRDPTRRFGNARQMALALESAVGVASARRVSEWVINVAGDVLSSRSKTVREVEQGVAADARAVALTPDPVGSQVSSISVARGTERGARRRLGLLGIVAVLVALPSFALIYYAAHRPAPVPVTIAASSAPLPPEVEPSAKAEPLPSAAPSATAPRVSVAPKRAAKIPAKKPCRIKTYVDDNGYTRFARECDP